MKTLALLLVVAGAVVVPAYGESEDPDLPEGHRCRELETLVRANVASERRQDRHSRHQLRLLEDLGDCLEQAKESPAVVVREVLEANPSSARSMKRLTPTDQIMLLREELDEREKIEKAQRSVGVLQARELEENKVHQRFAGSNFGFALAGAHFFGDPLVTNARIGHDGTVEIVETLNRDIRLAAVYTIMPWTWNDDRVGLGPLVVASPGIEESQAPVTIGAGLMLGVRSSARGGSLGIGLVYGLDAEIKVLREDFMPGLPAPVDPVTKMRMTEPVYVRKTRSSLMVVVTYSPSGS